MLSLPKHKNTKTHMLINDIYIIGRSSIKLNRSLGLIFWFQQIFHLSLLNTNHRLVVSIILPYFE